MDPSGRETISRRFVSAHAARKTIFFIALLPARICNPFNLWFVFSCFRFVLFACSYYELHRLWTPVSGWFLWKGWLQIGNSVKIFSFEWILSTSSLCARFGLVSLCFEHKHRLRDRSNLDRDMRIENLNFSNHEFFKQRRTRDSVLRVLDREQSKKLIKLFPDRIQPFSNVCVESFH